MSLIGEEVHDERLVKEGNFEKDPPHLKNFESLKIRGLKKQYSNGTVAVKNESMTMFKGQIFALLGHNGAGKTTTIGMLTGLLDPTAGSASFAGYEIFNDIKRMREDLGVCP
jgi:ABC-type multidrug transport system ATPase subunit